MLHLRARQLDVPRSNCFKRSRYLNILSDASNHTATSFDELIFTDLVVRVNIRPCPRTAAQGHRLPYARGHSVTRSMPIIPMRSATRRARTYRRKIRRQRANSALEYSIVVFRWNRSPADAKKDYRTNSNSEDAPSEHLTITPNETFPRQCPVAQMVIRIS